MQELGEHRRSAASLASPTGRGLGGRGSREIKKYQQGRECVDASESYEFDRPAEPAICNWFS